MDSRVLEKLEYNKIVAMLATFAVSEMGKERANNLQPTRDYQEVVRMQQQTSEAEQAIQLIGKNPVDAFPDVRDALKKIKATLFLGMGELLQIGRACQAMRQCRHELLNQDIGELLMGFAEQLPNLREIEDEIFQCILSPDHMADNASPQLTTIRKQIQSAHARVREKLNHMIHSSAYKTYLQESIITMRNGRYVLPVKAEHRGNVPGLVHDQSGSGATLFIEPTSIVEIDNDIKKMQADEQEEMQRILIQLTQQIAPYDEILRGGLFLLAHIDTLFAKARLAQYMRANPPKLNQKGILHIKKGRHPLIDANQVVPIDIWLGDDFQTLIITGPNTGGKTVTLKTVGLFVSMTQSGLFIPAEGEPMMAVFEDIFADIGDEQSIEQSLSTFSSHMKNLVHILERANEQSLVLLDELGSGTDPIEGAALAQAILQDLHARSCTTLATTHYSELKEFALTRQGMENASMEFDVNTLSPTYRLFIGIPGKSNAFEIAKRLGLQDRVINSAQQFLNREDVRFEDVLSSAESQKRKAEEERLQAEQLRREVEILQKKLHEEQNKLSEKQEKILQKARDEARELMKKTRDESEIIIKQLRETEKVGDSKQRSRMVQESRDRLRNQEVNMHSSAVKKQNEKGQPLKMVRVGEEVYVVSLDQQALVLETSKNDDVLIQVGILKMNVKLSDLRSLSNAKKKEIQKSTSKLKRNASVASMELDVRGETVEEAMWETDKFLDEAFLNGLQEVNIIHGKGTGALREGLHLYLKHHPRVARYRLGNYGEGEAGVTVITLK